MGFLSRQIWTLTRKNLTIIGRFWLSTLLRAFLGVVIYVALLARARDLFFPPSDFGIGSPTPLRSFENALNASTSSRHTVAFVTNGLTGLDDIISNLSSTIRAGRLTPVTLRTDTELLTICKSSIRGTSPCFAALSFHSNPSSGGIWNYTIRADGSLGEKIYVGSETNDAQIYVLPLQHAVDTVIAAQQGTTLPNPSQYPYTSETSKQRSRDITRLYMGTIINILAVAYFIGLVGVIYHLTGFMASERELKMSQLIEAMMPNSRRWEPQAIRLLSYHLSFDLVYLPGWIIVSAIISGLNYPQSNFGIMVGFVILAGLALTSWALAFGSLFRKSQLSGITATIVSIVLSIIVQVQTPTSTGAIVILCLVFPPCNFTIFLIYMAYWQQKTLPANLSQSCPSAPWSVPGWAFFVFALIHILVFPVIAAYTERALHGTSSKSRNMDLHDPDSAHAVRIQGLSKTYKPSWWTRNFTSRLHRHRAPLDEVRAVDDLNLVIRKGELSVLLGANGSGKSTTMDILAGLQIPSAGTVQIDGRGGLAVCPQQNVLFDTLTCEEHVRIFNRLKATGPDDQQQIKDLLIACDLEKKLDQRAKTLSGGQKRKLQLAMMLTGGSSVCLIDEVSSGIDPLSRRSIWSILLAQRGHRSMLLTTHALDEADLLSDRITILSKGRLVAGGSSVELKDQYGGGYRVKIYSTTGLPELDSANHAKTIHADHVTYHVGDSASAAAFIAKLADHGIKDYRVLGPQIEDVFLKLAADAEERSDSKEETQSTKITSLQSSDHGLKLASGQRLSFLSQTWVLFRKRYTVLRRNYLPHFCAVLIPIVTAGLVTRFLVNFDGKISCSPRDFSTIATTYLLTSYEDELNIPIGPPGQVSSASLNLLYPGLSAPLRNVSTLQDLENYVSANYSVTKPGGFFVDRTGNAITGSTFAWQGNYGLSFAVLVQNLLDSSILGTVIETAYQPFDLPLAPSAGKTIQLIFYFGLAMCVYPAFFGLYPTSERRNNVRALHYSNGIRALPLWLAYATFDFLYVLVISAVCVIIFASSTDAIWYLPWLFPVFFLYGLAATLLAYVASLFVASQLAAFATAAGYLCITFLISFIGYLVIITYAPAAEIDNYVTIAHFTISLISPSSNLLRAFLLAFNEFSLLCDGTSVRSYPGDILVYGGPILYTIGQSLVLLAILVWWDSGWKPSIFMRRKHRGFQVEESDIIQDDEVRSEKKRVETCHDDLRVNHVTKKFGRNTAVDDISFGVPSGSIMALLGPNAAGKSTTISMIRGEIAPSHSGGDIFIKDTSIVSRRAAARLHLGVCPQFDAMDRMTVQEHLRFYARARGIQDVQHNVQKIVDAVGLGAFKRRMAGKLSGGNKRKLSLGIALIGNPSVLLVDEGSSGMDAAAKRVMWRTLRSVSAGRSLLFTTHSMEEADDLADRIGIMAKRMLALGTSDSLRQREGDAYHVHVVHKDAPKTSEEAMTALKDWIRSEFPAADVEDRSFHGQIRFSVPNRGYGATSTERLVKMTDHKSVAQDAEKIIGASDIKEMEAHDSTISNMSSDRIAISTLFASLEANKARLGMAYYSVGQTTMDQVFLNVVSRHKIEEGGHEKPAARSMWKDLWAPWRLVTRRINI